MLGALTGEAGFTREQVGKIQVMEYATYVAVARDIGEAALARLNAGRIKGKKVTVRRVGKA
ncbi:DbpA RNA binding domain-containing protein [Ottowia pentelensis]|uniref:DbpA RNA binding domain-containing protein n=1 Tax=Ottowia pentelensis TaxID=511108 RepID=UPI00362ED147